LNISINNYFHIGLVISIMHSASWKLVQDPLDISTCLTRIKTCLRWIKKNW